MKTLAFSQLDLLAAILGELNRQQPGVTMNERQFYAVVRAADAIIDAMAHAPNEDRVA